MREEFASQWELDDSAKNLLMRLDFEVAEEAKNLGKLRKLVQQIRKAR